MSVPAWLPAAVLAAPERFPLLCAVAALPAARLRGPRSLALPAHEVLAVSPAEVRTAALGLAGPASPLPAGLAQELAALPEDAAAAGLLAAVEERLLAQLVTLVGRRGCDDPAAQRERLDRLAGPFADDEYAIAGRLCDGRTADALACRVAVAAGCRVRVVPATGAALPCGPGTGAALGRQRLGGGQVLGEQVTAAEFGCRVILGPVAADQAERLRPGGERFAALRAALVRALPPCLRCRVDLLVRGGGAAGLGAGTLAVDARLDGAAPPCEAECLFADVTR